MKYTYATLLLNETGAEINEQNLSAVLEASQTEFSVSRVKAVIAALEDVDIDEHVAAAPTGDEPDHEDHSEEGEPVADGATEAFDLVASDDGESESTATDGGLPTTRSEQTDSDDPTEGR
ncbi:50S ribosomal protein L12P [Halogeometricum pallidum JCM 14848]|uniref:50S ribosomal protein L12P n=1 Tax=Halogeometricum pallidum JCM 14848 TaxID=1227487 RepID=M0DB59_HALPD|nr:50S ribosomal protein L12 [Halogeometricum pallidum]ELZ31414.1 50S ribosomal protein L12P [Halogeometricum pallidum JCM 14848]